jgi:hypothetical protein
MFWNDAGTLFARLCFAGPLLYIGLSMVMDPQCFMTFTAAFAQALRTFERRFDASAPPLAPLDTSVRTPVLLRVAGVAVCLFALLVITGIPS